MTGNRLQNAVYFLLDLVKPSPLQIAVAYLAAILQMLVVFHKPIGLGDTTADILQVVSLACWVVFFVFWKRQKRAIKSGQAPVTPQTQPKWMFWLIIALLFIVSLSGVFWLPYTGIILTFPQLVLVSITTCILSIIAFLVGRRLTRPKV